MRFKEALKRPGVNIISEFKRASPSLGDIDALADPVEKALLYERGGAAAMSILCDAARFKGSVADLRSVAAQSKLPLLAKDFITTRERLAEVAEAGASAALLIARYLTDAQLADLLGETRRLGMDALVETHTEDEIARAVAAGADIVGVNCRDLETLSVDLSVSERLVRLVPDGCVKVAESGVSSRGDIVRLAGAGADAFLVGTTLMKAEDPVEKILELKGEKQ